MNTTKSQTGALECVRVFPCEVHESLAALRLIAKAATSKDDPQLRRCTPDEYALALTQRKPYDCSGHSNRTGLPCQARALKGGQVCRRHGGALKHVRRAMARRLADAAPRLVSSMLNMATQTDKLTVAQKAAQTRVPSVRGISQPDAAKLVSEAVEDFDRAHRREEPAERSDTQRT